MADLPIILRPIVSWPGELLAEAKRETCRFTATYRQTTDLLRSEVRNLGAREVIVQLGIDEDDIRIDGDLRASAKPRHPGVIVSFESRHGSLSYATDRFGASSVWRGYNQGSSHVPGWQNNLRAIALGLEALRKVDRYGVSNDGSQYTGFRAPGSGIPMEGPKMTLEDAARLLMAEGGHAGYESEYLDDVELIGAAYRHAAKTHHPDAGGDPVLFARLTEARDLLLAHA